MELTFCFAVVLFKILEIRSNSHNKLHCLLNKWILLVFNFSNLSKKVQHVRTHSKLTQVWNYILIGVSGISTRHISEVWFPKECFGNLGKGFLPVRVCVSVHVWHHCVYASVSKLINPRPIGRDMFISPPPVCIVNVKLEPEPQNVCLCLWMDVCVFNEHKSSDVSRRPTTQTRQISVVRQSWSCN